MVREGPVTYNENAASLGSTMATAQQIKALIESRLKDDDQRFYTVAMQIAAHAARKGQGRFAAELRELIDKSREQATRSPRKRPVLITTPRGELEGLLAVSYPEERLSHMVLDGSIRGRLERIVREYRARARLRDHGLQPRRKLLLTGPPGSGKTMTALALAGELGLPLMVIRLDGIITKFMGETAAKLRLVFDAMADTRGVYLFDEFDAIGSQRALGHDVGEIRRVLNSFLLFIEQDDSDSLIVAATNHGDSLDHALFRRFDDIVTYALPNRDQVLRLIRSRLSPFDTNGVDWDQVAQAGCRLSYADLGRACDDAAKEAVLDGSIRISAEALIRAFDERRMGAPDSE